MKKFKIDKNVYKIIADLAEREISSRINVLQSNLPRNSTDTRILIYHSLRVFFNQF